MNKSDLVKIAEDYEKLSRLKDALDSLGETDVSINLYRILTIMVEILDRHLGTPAIPAAMLSSMVGGTKDEEAPKDPVVEAKDNNSLSKKLGNRGLYL